jgi:aldehyde dehydrogenase (NAD+)
VPPEAHLMREEIFGPLLPVIGFESLDVVITAINATPKPLSLYIYSRNRANIQQVLQRTVSGGACVNHSLVQFLHGRLPFGGINHSGIGNAHGHYGFKAFSHERSVVQTQLPLVATLFAAGEVPPLIRKALRVAFRWL